MLAGLILALGPRDDLLAGRTERSLSAAGLAPKGPAIRSLDELTQVLADCVAPVVLMRAGAFLAQPGVLAALTPSATGKPLAGFGAVLFEKGECSRWRTVARGWRKLLDSNGGDLDRGGFFRRRLPEPASIYLEPVAAHELSRLLREGRDLAAATAQLTRDRRIRTVHLPTLDALASESLRVLQLVTSIQIGGAERVALDLATSLEARGVRSRVAAFGGPSRTPFPEPPEFLDLAHLQNSPDVRADAIATACCQWGADLVHAHLIRAREAAAIKARGLPLAVTLHNMPEAWPTGFAELEGGEADLLLACARTIERAAADSAVPVRTCWNGISADRFAPSEEHRVAGAELRRRLGWDEDDFVVACIANPRRQKRLDRLAEITHRLGAQLANRKVRLLLAGEAAFGSENAREAASALEAAIERWQIGEHFHHCGAVADPAPVLAAADVFVSVSAYEGLSLAQLEALAAGVPVVATDVGGAAEIAAQSSAMRLLPVEASANAFADELAKLAHLPGAPREAAIPDAFRRHCMAARAEWLYPCAIRRSRRSGKPEGLWLIANNFSTGGAQSSARRLLTGLAERGVKARAAVVQESLRRPTRGRAELQTAGVPVAAVPSSDRADAPPEEIVGDLLALLAADPPETVVFWNLLTSCKVLLADALPDTAIFDVSPGEMFFDSLERWFERPPAGLPYRAPRDYGERLAGVVVKYRAEAGRASAVLGAPVHVIPNGVRLPPWHRRTSNPHPVIGTAARISPAKRLEDLVDAFRLAHPRIPKCVLRIAGGVETGAEHYARDLRRRARGLPVEWVGEVSDTNAFLAELDLFAMISEPAGCPNTSLEAMAAGLPVIATDVGGAAEQVLDNETGRLVPRRDAAKFAAALVELVTHSGERRRLGANAREHIARHFALDRMLDDYSRVFFGSKACAAGSPLSVI